MATSPLPARPLAQLQHLQVPSQVPPGGKFYVLLPSTGRGSAAGTAKAVWRASGCSPAIQPRNVHAVAGARHAHRPSARAGGSQRAANNFITTDVQVSTWTTGEELPWELCAEDVGWLPGPVGGSSGRARPRFKGAQPGPTDPSLGRSTGARRIMQSVQFTARYLQRVVELAQQHVAAWARTHTASDAVERAFKAELLRPEHVELWLAIRARIAMVNVGIPAAWLWDPNHPHAYDRAVHEACPFDVYQWLNRHLSFGEYGEDGADGDGAELGFDRYIKRRELSDMARAQAARAFRPGQHVGIDDGVRPTRHLDGSRQRHKAAVHTGRPFDSLNCATTNYFLNWEEQGWTREENANTIPNRLLRLVKALSPNVGHCIWLDRGYGIMEGAVGLHNAGYNSTSIMPINRIGLPRRFIEQLKHKMACPSGCKHRADDQHCRRWCWTVLHKGEWELQIWSDGKALVIALSDCTSATRVVQVGRSVEHTCVLADAIEGVGLYGIFGRSCTDGGDQHRKKISLAARRQKRQGPKGALFDAEIGFVNGAIIMKHLRGSEYTTWDFCEMFMSEVLGSVCMRQRMPTATQAMQVAQESESGMRTRAEHNAHLPIHVAAENRRKRRRGEQAQSGAPVTVRGSKCTRSDCAPGSTKYPDIFCPGCNSWYHLPCFNKSHTCCLKM